MLVVTQNNWLYTKLQKRFNYAENTTNYLISQSCYDTTHAGCKQRLMGSLITVESNEKFNDIIYSADKWVRDDNWAVHPNNNPIHPIL